MASVKETEFYERLGVPPDASQEDIRKAYRKQAVKLHPDKNPDDPKAAERFKDLGEAYEVLSDEDKRRIYDKRGKQGLSDTGFHAGNAEDLFSRLFGFGRERERPDQGEDVVSPLNVTLEDLYNGKTSKVAITRNVLCNKCNGAGTKSAKEPEKCKGCGGRGVRVVVRQMGMFIQQSQMQCSECQGRGDTIKEKDRCTSCKGERVVKDRKVLEIVVEKGMKENSRITFPGESDQAPGIKPGDVVFVVKQREHETFKRAGNDLLMVRSIKLVEALTGLAFNFKHMDGRNVIVRTEPGAVIKPGDMLCVRDEGMPQHRNPFNKGNLFIKFSVVFPLPEQISPAQVQLLEQALPPRDPQPMADPDAENVTLAPIAPGMAPGSSHSQQGGAEDSDDEQGQHGQRVQCQQQ
jgi:DnaJ family protein A protein 2